MDEQLSILLERAARYRSAARTVPHEPVKEVLLCLAANYVALAQLLVEHPAVLRAVAGAEGPDR